MDGTVERVPATPLRRREKRRARARSAVGPQVVHEAIRLEGKEELERPVAALAWSGVAAGLSMGFSLVAEGILRDALPDAPWSEPVSKLGYTLGFLFVILGRQQLFTENTLTVILPLMQKPTAVVLAKVARLWAVVLAANVAGALLFAWSLSAGELFAPGQRAAFAEVARSAWEAPFGTIVLRGVYGGWLIALMVWLLPAAKSARFFVIVAVTWLVGAGHFSHVVAGSVEVLYLVAEGEVSFLSFLGGFLLPAFLGNCIGGVSLVAAVNHAQVVAGKSGGERTAH